MKTNAKFIYSVLAGAAVGAIVGYLFTTDKGSDFRSDVVDYTKKVSNDIRDKAMDTIDNITERVSDIRGSRVAEELSDTIKGGYDKVKRR
jgi:gas vesicle protein